MKRDMEIIRKILHDVEGHEKTDNLLKVSDPFIAYQISLMIDASLINGVIVKNQLGVPSQAAIIGLTWAGHDFLDSARDDTMWKKAFESLIKPGASWTFSILSEWLKQEARRRIFGTTINTPAQ